MLYNHFAMMIDFQGKDPHKAIYYKNRGHSYSRIDNDKLMFSDFREMVKLELDNIEYRELLTDVFKDYGHKFLGDMDGEMSTIVFHCLIYKYTK